MNNILCNICNERSVFLLRKDDYDHYKCFKCGLIFVYPFPTIRFIEEEIYSEKNKYQSNKASKIVVKEPTSKQEKILDFIKRTKGKSLLDIGCSNGEFMIFCSKIGLKVKGIEVNKSTALFAQSLGLDVYNGTVESFESIERFDYIFMGDIIEHVSNPKGLLNKCKSLLNPNGFIVIITPNIESFWSRMTFGLYKMFGIPWSSLEPPYHLSNFSTRSMDSLLQSLDLTLFMSFKNMLPTLKYELGSLHLVKVFKKDRSIKSLLFAIFAFSLYSICYIINKCTHFIRKEEFSMTYIARL